MSLVYADRVMESSTTTGTGTYTLGGAVSGFQTFGAVGNGNTAYYCAADVDVNGVPDGGWEVGLGTYTASGTLLARTTILASSNSNAAVNWGAGTRRVFLVQPATVISTLLVSGGALGTPSSGTLSNCTGLPASGVTGLALVQLAQIVTAGSQTTVDFTGISGAYNNLVVYWTAQDTTSGTSATQLRLRLNNDSTSGDYTSAFRIGSQAGAAFANNQTSSSNGGQVGHLPQVGNTNLFSTGVVTIVGYAGTLWHKRVMSTIAHEDGTNGAITGALYQFRWQSTAAVTRLTFTTDGTAFVNGSVFTLYGVN